MRLVRWWIPLRALESGTAYSFWELGWFKQFFFALCGKHG